MAAAKKKPTKDLVVGVRPNVEPAPVAPDENTTAEADQLDANKRIFGQVGREYATGGMPGMIAAHAQDYAAAIDAAREKDKLATAYATGGGVPGMVVASAVPQQPPPPAAIPSAPVPAPPPPQTQAMIPPATAVAQQVPGAVADVMAPAPLVIYRNMRRR